MHSHHKPVNPETGSNALEFFQDVLPLLTSRPFSGPSPQEDTFTLDRFQTMVCTELHNY